MPIRTESLESRLLFAVTATPLVTFNGTNGNTPFTIVQDNSGDLIGITQSGGANNAGEIFRLPKVDSPQLQILASFTTTGPEGRTPDSLAMNAAGDIFGTTTLGGANNVGTLWRLARGASTIETLLDLDDTPAGGAPVTAGARLAPFTDPAGNLYGVITPGNVFRIAAGTSTITPLDFVLGTVNDLTLDPSGNLFGTTFLGGSQGFGFGSIFTIAAGSSTATTVASFDGAAGGSAPNGLVVDSAGNLYGSTVAGGANGFGTVFKVLAGTSTIQTIGSFDGTNGNQPAGKPALDDHGNLFGLTHQGGANDDSGTFYKVTSASGAPIAVLSLGPNQTTLPPLSNNFGDIQQPIVKQAEAGLDPDGWHYDYPPPPPGNPEAANADIPTDDDIRLGLPIGGPPAVSTAAREFRPPNSAADNAEKFGELIQFEAALALGTQFVVTVTGNFPPSAVGGGGVRLPVKVNIRNDGDNAVVREDATVKLFLSADGQVAGATEIASATPRLTLKPGQSKAVALRVTSFPNLPQGSYQVIAQITDSSNNTAVGAGPSIAIAPPFVTAVISNFNPAKPSAVHGKKATFLLTLTNNGNVPATGTAAISATLTTDSSGAGGTPVTVKPLKVKLKPAAARTFKLSVTVPADLVAGSYFLSLTLDVAAIGDANPADGVAVTSLPLSVS